MISESTGKTSDKFPCTCTQRKDCGVLSESCARPHCDPLGLCPVNPAVETERKRGKEYRAVGTPLHCSKCVRRYTHFGEHFQRFFEVKNTYLSYDAVIPLLGVYPSEMQTCVHIIVHSSSTLNWKHPKCLSGDEQINRWRQNHAVK